MYVHIYLYHFLYIYIDRKVSSRTPNQVHKSAQIEQLKLIQMMKHFKYVVSFDLPLFSIVKLCLQQFIKLFSI